MKMSCLATLTLLHFHTARAEKLTLGQRRLSQEFAAQQNNKTQESIDNLLDNLVDKIFDRAVRASPSRQKGLNTMPGRLAMPNLRVQSQRTGLIARPGRLDFARPRPAVGPISALRSPNAVLSHENVPEPFKKKIDELRHQVRSHEPLRKKIDALRHEALATATVLSAAVLMALGPNAALADQPVSPFQRVDKTGIIGGAASIIENGIDTAHNGLAGAGWSANTYGISIVLFTLLIRTLTFPLTKTQLESSVKVQQIAPLQKKIQAAFPGKNQEQTKNQLMAQLYQAADVNPLAGCFPALVQIPVFISLYRALTNLVAEDKLQEGFLWLPSLEGPIYGGKSSNWFTSIFSGTPALGWDETLAFLSLPAILIVTQSISSRILTPPKPEGRELTPQEAATQNVVLFLPFLIALFSLNVPAGLSVYWIANNVLTTALTVGIKASIPQGDLPDAVTKLMATVPDDNGLVPAAAGNAPVTGETSTGSTFQSGMADEESPETQAQKRKRRKKGKKAKR